MLLRLLLLLLLPVKVPSFVKVPASSLGFVKVPASTLRERVRV
jgi:hypothetical protein